MKQAELKIHPLREPQRTHEDELLANQHTIIANQERIQSNQSKLDLLLAHQEAILANQAKLDLLIAQQEHIPASPEMIGVNPVFREIVRKARTVAGADATVLVCGETGTGKELLARDIHAQSARRDRPLVTVNCATLPAGLIESDLFGHEKGAFTGAFQRKLGRFEVADGSTIFLDEVGEVPMETQAKFLRILQHGEFERVGGTQTLKVDVRVIAATNQSLERLIAEQKFRSDLFYRLNVFPITLPPLRQRPEDILLLVNHFARKYARRFGRDISSINQDSLRQLQEYEWPGNIRELEHIIERAVLIAEGDILDIESPSGNEREWYRLSLAERPANADFTGEASPHRFATLEENERHYIKQVLQHTRGRITGSNGAAAILGLPPSTLRSRMKKLGLN
ncbi:MAG: sigma-54 dependent transcriptional regulator [Acidobacteriota bacterium]|nr:sigma-54 dependent transcriptional regulator [Acidobacteriota bacterium]